MRAWIDDDYTLHLENHPTLTAIPRLVQLGPLHHDVFGIEAGGRVAQVRNLGKR